MYLVGFYNVVFCDSLISEVIVLLIVGHCMIMIFNRLLLKHGWKV